MNFAVFLFMQNKLWDPWTNRCAATQKDPRWIIIKSTSVTTKQRMAMNLNSIFSWKLRAAHTPKYREWKKNTQPEPERSQSNWKCADCMKNGMQAQNGWHRYECQKQQKQQETHTQKMKNIDRNQITQRAQVILHLFGMKHCPVICTFQLTDIVNWAQNISNQ